VRRELDRLLARDMVNEVSAESGKRAITLYEATPTGLEALHRWVSAFPGPDQVVIKHPIMLKTWLADGVDAERLLEMIDRHIEATRARLDVELWSRERAHDVGMTEDPALRFKLATLNYAIRALYAELSNIEQLRDEIARGTAQDPVRRVARPKGRIRRRR
jgi:DNA-binding PadR family transcriptional regulator